MRSDRKGEFGFMEAIISVMVVSIALTSFMGLLAYSHVNGTDDAVELDTGFLDRLSIENGKIVGDYNDHIDSFIERNGLNGAELKVTAIGPLSDISLDEVFGDNEGTNAQSITGTAPISSEDGRSYIASYEVIYWWD